MLLYINSEKKSRNSFNNLVGMSVNHPTFLSYLLADLSFCDSLKHKSKFRIYSKVINTSYTGMIFVFA